ncbi:MAG: histidine kinase dimerization/phosphoacceptor domain -containing protein [Candidatus Desulfatibia sp.]|uniref:histidine kinase dimerization/phosphoacceptor domain -containing protein n=1 Tax=Candidatus Desulfatibia sp. TaxID=3101189 RepID=UPI002F33C6EC
MEITAEIVKGVVELKILTAGYLLHPGDRSLIQWQSRYDSVTKSLTGGYFRSPDEKSPVDHIIKNLERIKTVFVEITIGMRKKQRSGKQENTFSRALQDRLESELLVKAQATVSLVFPLQQKIQAEFVISQKRSTLLTVVLLLIITLGIIGILLWINQSVARPIAVLEEGTRIIGSGNLDYKVGITTTDEIGQLSRAFDKMTHDLKKTTASVSELNREITDRKRAEEQVKASLKEKKVLLREIHHRVKNNMQLLISLLRLQADKIEDKKYADMFKDGENRIRSMSLIHEKLYQTQDFANINFGEHIKSLVDGLFVSYGVDTNKVSLNIDIKDISIDLENAIPCGLIINELVSNSLKYAFPQGREGEISIVLRPISEDELELTVSDDGIGIPEDLDIEQTDTMGLTLVKVLAEHQLDGKIDVDRTKGTQFRIKFKRTD